MAVLFSIIIPVYNAEKTIERAVLSLIEQGYDSLQVILIENGSTDNSYEKCVALSKSYPQTVEAYVNEEKGVSAARNRGLSLARGEIIGFCDADDYYERDVLAKIKDIFISRKVDVVVTGFSIDEGNSERIVSCKKEEEICADIAIKRCIKDASFMGSVWNKFFRREILVNGVEFPKGIYFMEDTYFNVDVFSRNSGIRTYVAKINTYYYVQNDDSATHNTDTLYDLNGTSIGNVTRYLIIDHLNISWEIKRLIKSEICKVAVDVARKNKDIDSKRFIKQIRDIKDCYSDLLKESIISCDLRGMKYSFWGLIFILKYHNSIENS